MSIITIRLMLDFGLAVLIWIVQRIVYPSFFHYTSKNLTNWHTKYTVRFSTIVIPLMLGQLVVSIYQLIKTHTSYTILSFLIISLIWIVTFTQFVPIHSNISKGKTDQNLLHSLVYKNWVRTVLWTLLFLYSFVITCIAH